MDLYGEALCAMFVAGISWLGGEGLLQSAAIELLGFKLFLLPWEFETPLFFGWSVATPDIP